MGKHFSQLPMEFSTLIEILRWRALQQPEQKAYSFLQDGEVEGDSLTYGELDCQARAIAALLQSQGVSGERALLLYPPGLEFIAAFFGCLYAGVVAVPAYPPRLNRPMPRLQAIVADAQATVVLTTTTILTQIERQLLLAPNLKIMQWLTTDSIPSGLEGTWQEMAVNSDTLAFLQYTSGSTAAPKGVMVSHGNILHNESIIQKAMQHTEKTIFVGWLPLFHDMGLIGNMLQPLYLGIPCILMSPVAFLQSPLRWLQAISRYKATTSGGPNFAYDLCVSKITEEQRATLDLSSWEVAFNGSEPIRAQTIERFTAVFTQCGFRREAFYPCYGMAETTLIVSGGLKAAPPVLLCVQQSALGQNQVVGAPSEEVDAQTLVGCGQPLQDLQIVIAHPETATRCAPHEVGEIWVKGLSVAVGYWNRTEQTKQTFQAYLADSEEGPFLRTGDLGFLRGDELFITGRLKDLIVIRGRNHYPQDIEKTVEQSHPALQLSSSAAFSIEAALEERLVVAIEVKRTYLRNLDIGEVIGAIRKAVVEEHELQVYGVLLLKTGSIPKTSSGKIQRYACKAGFLNENLDIVGSSILEDSYTPVREATLTQKALLELKPQERHLKLASYLQEQVAQVFKVAPSQLDEQQPLSTVGLDSLMAIELQNRIETNLGVVLPMARFLEGSSIDQLAGEVLAQLTASPIPRETTLASALSANIENALSYGQQALYFLHQLAPESPAYNIVGAARLQGELDISALGRGFQSLVERHPTLRTTFTNLDGQPIQQIHEHKSVCFQHEDVSTWSEASLNDRLVAEAHRPFNLEQGPLLRVSLFTRYAQRQASGLSPQEHTLLLVVHHIIADFWSGAVLIHELGILYQMHKAGTKATLSPLALLYTDYVRTSAAMLASPEGERLWAYWQKQLAGELPVLNLPTDRPRPPIQTYRGASQPLKLSANLTQRLKTLSHAHRATLYMTLLAAFQVLLYRYTGQEDLLVGSPTIGRSRADLAGVVGYFVNPVVCRGNLSGNPTFEAFLSQVRSSVLDALAHQDYPFPQLVEQLQPMRDSSRSPLFQVMFVLQKAHLINEEGLAAFALGEAGVRIKLGELELESLSLERRIAQFELTLMMAEVDGALSAAWQYNTDLFDAATIARMANHFQTLLEGIVALPQQSVSNLPLLTDSEQQQLLLEWNATLADYNRESCLHKEFETQVKQTPNAVAVVFEEEQITYQELNQRANQLAHHLQVLGVEPEVLVGIYLERSLEMVVSLLAVLKAGGAYVPLDPTYPKERLAFMLSDAQISVLLTQEKFLEKLPEHKARVVCLDKDGEVLRRQSVENPVSKVTASNLAYAIYTSGSTGKPKGVMNTHKGICNRLFWMQDTYQLTTLDRVLQKTPFSFDVSIWEFFWPLMTGARLVVARPGGHQDGAYLVKLIQQQQITTLHFVPSMLQVFLEEPSLETCQNIRQVMCSGEALPFKLQERFFARLNADLHNLYGPTEAAVDVTFWASERHSHKHIVPIGRPIANTQIYLLDTHLQPVPVGVPGELHIGGVGLARGYLNQAELTALKFIPNPFSNSPGARLYKTGDLARYQPDGSIEYLGRADYQVKLRGFRIELDEIEAVLSQHPAVREVVVLVRDTNRNEKRRDFTPFTDVENPSNITGLRRLLKGEIAELQAEYGKERLVAYFVTRSKPAPTVTELRRFLLEKLPNYMVPAAFVMLDALPLMPNGKIDRRSLPDPGKARPDLEKAFVAPRTQVEEVLAEVWAEMLNIEQVGIHDNFFELGGDSIRSIQVLAKAQARNLSFSLQQLFQHQTIDTLAQEVTFAEPSSLSTLKTEAFSLLCDQDRQKLPKGVEDAYPLARVQAGVIFHTQSMPDSPMYHDIFLYNLQVHFDTHIFQACVQQVVDRHPILRTSFDLTNFSEPLQLVHQTVAAPFQVEDLRGLSPEEQQQVLFSWIEAEKRRNFDWSCPPFIRFFIHRLTDQSFYLTFSCHTSILDGWSKACLLTELLHRYHALLNGEVSAIEPTPTIAYRDFIALERSILKSKECQDYWTQKLAGCVTTKLPQSHQTHRRTDAPQIGFLDVPISPEISDGLKKLARRAEVPLKSVLLAAHLKVMSLLSGDIDILTGLESNGRLEEADGEKTLGIHLNTVPFRFKLTVGTWIDLVQQVFAAERELLPFRRYPYADLHQLVGRQALQPLVDTVFNYTHFHVYQHLQALKDLAVLGARGFGETHFTLRSEFNLNHASDCIQLDLECNLTQIGDAQLETIGNYFTQTLTAMSTQPFEHHESQCLLPEQERLTLLMEWNNTATRYPQNCCIHQQIEATAARNPDAIAVVFDEHLLTYQELNTRANALAHYLQRLGVRPNVRVALCVERSLEMIVGILGILKAGGAYVPLDPTYPQERLAFMLEDAQVPVILTQTRLVARLPKHQTAVLCLDSHWDILVTESTQNPISTSTLENLAYVIYTSGSTGQPKGVLVTHQNLAHSTNARIAYYPEPFTSFLLVSSFAFDSSVASIFWTLCQDKILVLPREGLQRDIWQLAHLIAQHQVSHWLSIPSLYSALLEHTESTQLISLRTVIVAGESCSTELVERHYQQLPNTSLFNEYGPTEATVWCSVYNCQNHDLRNPVPIGRPIANTQIYLLNSYLQPVPIGVRGEIHIGGNGVARGYHNRPELTADKFIPNPLNQEPGTRLYKTGDLGRYLPDGNIEFLGRIDSQVKLRGYRIELTAIEVVLQQHSDVLEAVVSVWEDESLNKRLVGYVVLEPGSATTTNELQRFLRQHLPEYMIPSVWVRLDALPLNANGKVDRQSLPAPDQVLNSTEQAEGTELEADPRTPVEEMLVNLWTQALGLDRVGIYDNFFELGGDSIQSIQIVAKANHAGLLLSSNQLFEHPTIAELATVIGKIKPRQAQQEPVQGPVALTPIQHWFFEQNFPEPHYWNQAVLLEVQPDQDPSLLEAAFQQLLIHHDALRLRFEQTQEHWLQTNHGPFEKVCFSQFDLSNIPMPEQESAIERIATELQSRLNLSAGPLLKVAFFCFGDRKPSRLLLILHHLVVDGVSFRILLEDLQTAYQQLSHGEAISLPPKTTSFQQWSGLLQEYAQSPQLQQELAYWLVEPKAQVMPLPVDYPEGSNIEGSNCIVSVSLTPEETRALLQEVPATYHTEINEVLLTALVQTTSQWTGTPNLLIDLEGHGREEIFAGVDLSRTVGWFTSVFPVQLNLDKAETPVEALMSVKEQMRRIPKRGIGYGLLRYCSEEQEIIEKLRNQPQAELIFNYLGQFDRVLHKSSPLRLTNESHGKIKSAYGTRSYLLRVSGKVVEGQFQMIWAYSENLHRQATVEMLAQGFVAELRLLIAHCQSTDAVSFIPSDFPEAELSEEELSNILANYI
ncbi:MAG: amino acid adenylation domain-containing protein [Stigonema ocellatum SAG 48.90 = DSM 106950]|nr:amino acid adenylation domain-containing protein [Stigonema ocellatum SAG 48.90 = DSM 106950]